MLTGRQTDISFDFLTQSVLINFRNDLHQPSRVSRVRVSSTDSFPYNSRANGCQAEKKEIIAYIQLFGNILYLISSSSLLNFF